MQVWVAPEQDTCLGLSSPHPKTLLAPSPTDFRGNPRIRALYQAIGIPTQNRSRLKPPYRQGVKGRFRKRVVPANVPSFRFLFRGANVPSFRFFIPGERSDCERTLVPVFVLGEHLNVPSFRFSFRGNIRHNPPFGKPLFCQPPTESCDSNRAIPSCFTHC